MDEDALRDLFSSLSALSFRKMFGGLGIYSNGMIFAVVLRDELMLKGDDHCALAYEEAGMQRWCYPNRKSGKDVAMPYWTAPEDALDNADEMQQWARMAYEAALRANK